MTRPCNHCQSSHPDTEEYWYYYIRKERNNKVYPQCRIHLRSRHTKYRIDHPKRYTDSLKKHARTPGGRYNKLRKRAKEFGREVSLSYKDYIDLVDGVCYYCRQELPVAGYGLDRVDAKKGYSLENCVPCCTVCNRAKSNLTTKEFAEWIARVAGWAKEAVL